MHLLSSSQPFSSEDLLSCLKRSLAAEGRMYAVQEAFSMSSDNPMFDMRASAGMPRLLLLNCTSFC